MLKHRIVTGSRVQRVAVRVIWDAQISLIVTPVSMGYYNNASVSSQDHEQERRRREETAACRGSINHNHQFNDGSSSSCEKSSACEPGNYPLLSLMNKPAA